MSKKIALTLGFATLVSLSAGNAFAADKSAIIDAIHAKQAEIRMEVADVVGKLRLDRIHAKQAQTRMEVAQMHDASRKTGLNLQTVASLGRIHAKQAETRQQVAQLIKTSNKWGVDPVTVAYLDRAKEAEGSQPQLAKNKDLAPSMDIDG